MNVRLGIVCAHCLCSSSARAVMMKMGQLYLELGVADGARLMFESVLAEDPGNSAAQKLLSDLDGKQPGD